jgi:small multidrug resistance pump
MTVLMMVGLVAVSVVGTTSLRLSSGFTRPGYSCLAVAGYGLAVLQVSFLADHMPLGVVYAIWGGGVTAALLLVDLLMLDEPIGRRSMSGIALILIGVTVLNLGGLK